MYTSVLDNRKFIEPLRPKNVEQGCQRCQRYQKCRRYPNPPNLPVNPQRKFGTNPNQPLSRGCLRCDRLPSQEASQGHQQLMSTLHPSPQATSDPKVWGPHLWAYLHYSAANYSDHPTPAERKEMKNWLCSLPVTIPCDNCSRHYRKYITKNKHKLDEICSDKNKLFNFLVDIHNKVNERNGKRIMSYEEALQLYKPT
jgi:hypothetical protein